MQFEITYDDESHIADSYREAEKIYKKLAKKENTARLYCIDGEKRSLIKVTSARIRKALIESYAR